MHCLKAKFICWGALFLASGFVASGAKADNATSSADQPPVIYRDKLSKLLTPLDVVLKEKAATNDLHADGQVLLNEKIDYVTQTGQRIWVLHVVQKAFNDAGVELLKQGIFPYQKTTQKVYPVSAQTIQPDDTRNMVDKDAVFFKSPQNELGDSIYNDQMEMLTVFPNIKPGSITEQIIVVEEKEPIIPGQYTHLYPWTGMWSRNLERLIVDLPKSYVDRLSITNLGENIPAPTRVDLDNNRQRLTWEERSTPEHTFEDSQAPVSQLGPAIWLSTLASWDSFATWYSSLVKGSDNLSPELKRKLDIWTKDAKAPSQILDIFYKHVANDVRYTAFELGKSGLQPHACMSVWDRQYGDCKDKANLLRAMLKYKGIDSWLTLLSTEHRGVINKGSPDYRQFNHCILQVKIGDQTIFCDPTITSGVPGLLGGSESSREVLLIKGDRAEWATTPEFQGADITYSFDLQLHPSGELSGWMEIKTTGFYASSYRTLFKNLPKNNLLSNFQQMVQGFFPGANVVDIKQPKNPDETVLSAGQSPIPFSVRAYVIAAGVLKQEGASTHLRYPISEILLPDVTNYKTRHHASYIWTDTYHLVAKIQVPPGYAAEAIPEPFRYDSSGANLLVAWSQDKNLVTATADITIKQSLFSVNEIQTLGDAISNLHAWTANSLTLTKSSGSPAAVVVAQSDADLGGNLPVMATGDGQLNLIDSEFPPDGNQEARRAALEKIPSEFPSDKKAIVNASIEVAALDLAAKKWEDVVSRLQSILAANRAALNPDMIGRANYYIASAQVGEGQKDQGCGLFQKIAGDAQVDNRTRSGAAYEAAELIAGKSPGDALTFLDKYLDLDSTTAPSLYAFYAVTAVKSNNSDRLKQQLSRLQASQPENLETILLEIIKLAQALGLSNRGQDALKLADVLKGTLDPAKIGNAYAQALKDLQSGADAGAIYGQLQQDIKSSLSDLPDIAATEQNLPLFSSRADAEASAAQHAQNAESSPALGCTLHAILDYPADDSLPSYLWDCYRYEQYALTLSPSPQGATFLEKLATLGDKLPHSAQAYYEIKLLHAKTLESQNQRAAAGILYDQLANQSNLPSPYLGPVTFRMGQNWEKQGDYVKALASYKKVEPIIENPNEPSALEAVLHAVFINFDQGNKPETLRLIKLLARAVHAGKSNPNEQMRDIVISVDTTSDASPAYWDLWHSWWPQWQQILAAMGSETEESPEIVPDIPNMGELKAQMALAKSNSDTKKMVEIVKKLGYAARVYPKAASEFVDLLPLMMQQFPQCGTGLDQITISILEPTTLSDPNRRRHRIMDLMVGYIDLNLNQKALDLMNREWTPDLEDNSIISAAIHRLWGLAAIRQNQDLDKARLAIEKDLKLSLGSDHKLTVQILISVYHALGREQDAATLSISGNISPNSSFNTPPIITGSGNDGRTDDAKSLADGTSQWLSAHKPDWWDYAQIKALDDAGTVHADNPNTDPYLVAEAIKANLMAVSISNLPFDTKREDVVRAYRLLIRAMPFQDEASNTAKSILDNALLPRPLKAELLACFLSNAGMDSQLGAFNEFKSQPSFQDISAQTQERLENFNQLLEIDRKSTPTIMAFLKYMSQYPLDFYQPQMIQVALTEMLQAGDIDDAETIYKSIPNYTFTPEAGLTSLQFQMAILGRITQAKQFATTRSSLRQITLDAYKGVPIVKPALYDQRRNYCDFDDLSEQETINYSLYMITQGLDPNLPEFWVNFIHALPSDQKSGDLKLNLFQAAFENASDDDFRAKWVQVGARYLDLDDLSIRQKYLTFLQTYRDSGKNPKTSRSIRLLDAGMAFRDGQLDSNLPIYKDISVPVFMDRVSITACLQDKNWDSLKSMLAGLSPDEITSPALIHLTLPALEAIGDKERADLVHKALDNQLYQHVLGCWFRPTGPRLEAVTQDMLALETTKDIPEAFTNFVNAHITRQRELLRYKMIKAYLDKDWNGTALAGQDITRLYPTNYTNYWFLGRSLSELGKKDDAIRALSCYCKYCHDEPWYKQGQALLAELTSESKQ